ncbi:hypothetical protein CERSUDRAFT_86080 [Gelatoporia subvermispora B]|uniref:Uncharacterized protein n=1 Tax=Ceriporiopsis subvermispora (strain B) TaxID=914234 RepID=M2PFF3_CERS8|nr:hypothetical protein CERSUDRAFT_86080 [Gelatoporia subvermispora B]
MFPFIGPASDTHEDANLRKLRDVEMRFKYFPGAGVRYLIRDLGDSVHALSLAFLKGFPDPEGDAGSPNLSRCSALRCISLDSWIHCRHCDYTWMSNALATITSDQMRQIEVRFILDATFLGREEVLNRIPFSQFDIVLSRHQFADVETFQFVFDDDSSRLQWWISELMVRMPILHSQDRIKLHLRDAITVDNQWKDESDTLPLLPPSTQPSADNTVPGQNRNRNQKIRG